MYNLGQKGLQLVQIMHHLEQKIEIFNAMLVGWTGKCAYIVGAASYVKTKTCLYCFLSNLIDLIKNQLNVLQNKILIDKMWIY